VPWNLPADLALVARAARRSSEDIIVKPAC